MEKRQSHGSIETFREVTETDLANAKLFRAKAVPFADESILPILATEGWLSTGEVDRMDDVIEPTAWKDEHLEAFMKNPALMFNHNWDIVPLGIWTELFVVPEKGLYGKNLIFGTKLGYEAALLIKAGVLRSYSVGFNPVEWTRLDTGGYRFVDAAPIEGSVVSVPANIGAVIAEAEERGLPVEYLRRYFGQQEQKPKTKKDNKMALENIQTEIETTIAPIKTSVAELSKEIQALAKVQNDLKEAAGNG